MSFDLAYLQIPVFQGINDQPVEPTASKAGNGAHLISQFNQLIDDVVTILNDLELATNTNPSPQSVVVNTDVLTYQAAANQNIVVIGAISGGNLIISLPSNPNAGDRLSVIRADQNNAARISNYGTFCGNQSTNKLLIPEIYKQVTLIYIDETIGWITDNQEYLVEDIELT
jgi:hypothetical protein